MQTLGVSDSMPHGESRLKSLFWPFIRSGSDVDYLGIQGYWVCTIVSVMTLLLGLFTLVASRNVAQGAFFALIFGILALFFYLGGVGVREGSQFAAAIVFASSALDLATVLLTSPVSVGLLIKAAITVVLFSNLRATWIAGSWRPNPEEFALPPRRSLTFGDQFVDQWPRWIWPKIRIVYYVFSLLIAFGMLLIFLALFFRQLMR